MCAMRFTAVTDDSLEAAFRSHAGARRFAFNRCLEMVKVARAVKAQDPESKVPWSGFDLINDFNAWKKTEAAGRTFVVDPEGVVTCRPGLPWQGQVCAQVFEEGAVDLGRALMAYSEAQRKRPGKVGFPTFKAKGSTRPTFRLRNRIEKNGRCFIRVGEAANPRSITLPVIGAVRVREDTRRLRRLLRPRESGQIARICFVTVTRHRGRWTITVTLEAPEIHPARRHPTTLPARECDFVGVDVGLTNYLVAARADGTELARVEPLAPLSRSLQQLQTLDRAMSRKVKGSKNRAKAKERRALCHAKVADQRKDFTNRLSSTLVKNHDQLCIEDLAVKNMVKNRYLARAISDAGWGMFFRQLTYKATWCGTVLTRAPRFFASSRTCSACGVQREEFSLSERIFTCAVCGFTADRDLNAAVNLAAWANAEYSANQAPDPEARGRLINARGGPSAGRRLGVGGTGPATSSFDEKKQEPTFALSVRD
jgi:putative transposase